LGRKRAAKSCKPDRITISGVHRGQQRAIYDARRVYKRLDR